MENVEEIVRRLLGKGRVNDVRLAESTNSDGELIYRVYVIYDESKAEPSVDEMEKITSEVWTKSLREGKGYAIVPSFISSKDARQLRSA